MMKILKTIKSLFTIKFLFIVFLFFSNIQTYSQTYTVSSKAGIASLSSVTSCGSNYTFSFTTNTNHEKSIYFSENSTLVNSSWGTFSGLGFSFLNWGNGIVGINDGNYNNTTIYALINPTSKTVTFSTSATSCGTTFYSKDGQNLTTASNWNTATNESGTNAGASDLTNAANTFIVQTGHTCTMGSSTAISGTLTVNGTLTPVATAVVSGGTLNGSGTVKVTRTTATADFSNQYTATIKTLTSLTVDYSVTTGAQTISALTYGNLKLSNTSGTNTAAGNITVNGTLTTTAGGTFDLASYQLLGTLGTITNNGTIKTSCTNNPAFVTGKNFGSAGTVQFAKTDGGQYCPAGTFFNLTFSNSSNTSSIAGDITVSGLFSTTTGGTIATANSINLNGTSACGGTINATANTITYATTAVNILTGTYYNLISNGNATACGTITIANNGRITTAATKTLNLGTYRLIASGTFNSTNNGTIQTSNTASTSPIPTNQTWLGTIKYSSLTGGQTIVQATYNNLTLDNTSGINTAGNNITVNATLTTTAGGTFDLSTYQLLGTLATITNNGTIKTSCTNNPAFVTGKNFGSVGTVQFAAATAQYIPSGTYFNVTCSNTNTVTAQGAITINGTVTTTSGGTLDFSTYQLLGSLSSIANGGIIKTSCTSNPPIPTGKTWNGTVQYANTSGYVSSGTYTNLTMLNSSGAPQSTGNLTINGTLITTASGTLDLSTYQLLGTLSTITNNGTIKTSNTTATPIPTAKTWGGTFQYANTGGSQTIIAGTYTNLTLLNSSGTNTIGSNFTVNGTFTTTSGGNNAIACGITVTTTSTFTNAGTITGPTDIGKYARFVNSSAVTNSGNIGASSSYIAFNGSISGGTVGSNVTQSSGTAATCGGPTLTISNPTTSVAAANICVSTLKVPIYAFNIAGYGGGGTLTNFTFTTTGNYTAAEVSNFKIWYNTTNSLASATLLATKTPVGTAGAQTFTAFSHTIADATTKYFWITMDVASTVTDGHTIGVNTSLSGDMTTTATKSGSTTTAGGTQTLKAAPSISVQPSTTNQTYCFNATPTNLSVTASGYGTLSYQWYSNTTASNSGGTIVTGATNSTYTPPTSTANTRYYYVTITGTCSPGATSNVSGSIITSASITSPGAITSNSPQCAGTGVTFTKGSCPGGTTCYWVSSATGTETTNSAATYTTGISVGTYNVWVRANNGSCWSSAVTATGNVNGSPTITAQPSTSATNACLNVVPSALSVTATGGSLTYQWYSNTTASNSGGTIVTGATSASYTPTTTIAGTKYYYCVVTGTCSPSTTSNVSGAVTTRALPIATASVSPTSVSTNGTINLTGGPDGMAFYTWSGPNSYSSSVQNPIISSPTTSNNGIYTLTVTNQYGCSDTESTASVTVSTATNYYYDGNGDMGATTNWWTNTNGTGSNPANFNADYKTYIILHTGTSTPNMGSTNWTVGGTGSKIIIGDGTNATNFTIPAGATLTTNSPVVIDVSRKATLTISNNTVPSLGTLAGGNTAGFPLPWSPEVQGSTVVFNSTGAQTIPANTYYNLTITGARTGTPNITLASGVITCAGTFTPDATGCNWVTTGNTLIFDGIGPQNIPAFTYNSLHTELGGTKTVIGNITISNKLRIGAISTLAADSYTINLAGADTIVTLIGSFTPGTSTVNYTNANNALVCAMNYYNLNLTGGNRTFQASDIISVSNVLTKGAGTITTTNSTFRFNGTSAQTCPAFTFFNLLIKNTHATDGVTLSGNITIEGYLTLQSGKLYTTSSYVVSVSNTNPYAVSPGTTTSYIDGKLKRSFAANLNSSANEYIFPVGDYNAGDYYLPFTINTVTTGATAPTVTIQAFQANAGGTADGTTLTTLSTSEYWEGTTTGDYTSGRVSLTRQAALGTYDAIGRSATLTGTYISKKGTISGTSLINSDITGFSFYLLGDSPIVTETYYYDGTGDISDITNWFTGSGGTGTALSANADAAKRNFTTDNRTYIFNTATPTLTSNWTITGANTNINIGDGVTTTRLTIPNGYTLSTLNNIVVKKYGELFISAGGTATAFGNFDIETNHVGSQQFNTVSNSGTLNVYGDFYQRDYSYSTFTNNATGVININGDFIKGEKTWFYNSGEINVTNGSFIVTGNQDSFFENRSGAEITIDNSNSPNEVVQFGNGSNIDLNEGMQLLLGSTFTIVKTNLSVAGQGNLSISGDLIVEDGNVDMNVGGGALTITEPGGLYIYDTDNSGDGILNLNYGALSLTNNGILFAEGIIPTSGANAITVTTGATMFIGNIGLYTGTNTNQLVVEDGGTLNYCGNKTAGADNVGTIEDGGVLNYAGGYYTIQTPDTQVDFDVQVGGMEIEAFADAEVCRAEFLYSTPTGGNVLLPIQLTMLYGICTNGEIEIIWQTASETNNDFFILYRSYNGITFEPVIKIDGAGNSSTFQDYSFNEDLRHNGIVYYKLSQTDYDGNTSFSKIIAIETCRENSKFEFFKDVVGVTFDNPVATNYVYITSIDGKILYSKSFKYTEYAEILLPESSGVYIISVINNDVITSQKFIR